MKNIVVTELIREKISIIVEDIVLNVPANYQKFISAEDILQELWDSNTIPEEYPEDYYNKEKLVESCLLKEIRHQLAIRI